MSNRTIDFTAEAIVEQNQIKISLLCIKLLAVCEQTGMMSGG